MGRYRIVVYTRVLIENGGRMTGAKPRLPYVKEADDPVAVGSGRQLGREATACNQ